jgi:hypothetical protein
MHHPVLRREINAVDNGQARVFEMSGWVMGPIPQPATKPSPVVHKQQPSSKEMPEDG